ncbi:hypothetical protein PLESTB_000691900 [Pleodorina starrii]|uniref:Uncharacterized protein n=1 Tax=Pleodorina starrii TaxID=330485 RepID=A0A9W6F287_9CHLO|nr:hypothetical protein PLESTM_001225400 [Pleodorina starrii]GLC52951.1 hypothetical protein PLESTB_000691900 [Pleodorina starrii]GLC65247.1 hypothetical protein PLESTF_000268200 [Pleodorina starrii]
MLVNSPNPKAPGKIWAPVCNITDSELAKTVAYVACSQQYQERRQPWLLPGAWYIGAQVSQTPLLIPTGKNFGTYDFNPTKVGGWVTITNATYTDVQLQDTKYKVSTSRCPRSAMLTFFCVLISNDPALRRRHQ